MDAAGELTVKYGIDHAMALDPALSAERLRHDIDPEMGLSARPVAGVALMLWDSSTTRRLSGAKAAVNFSVMRVCIAAV